MVTRQFAVICALASSADAADVHVHPSTTEQLRVELLAGGLEDVVVDPYDRNDRCIIRGLAPAQSKDAARDLMEGQIDDATIDLIILEPGVWVDDGRELNDQKSVSTHRRSIRFGCVCFRWRVEGNVSVMKTTIRRAHDETPRVRAHRQRGGWTRSDDAARDGVVYENADTLKDDDPSSLGDEIQPCGHLGCGCATTEPFCSAFCREHFQEPTHAGPAFDCGCDHDDCKAVVGEA